MLDEIKLGRRLARLLFLPPSVRPSIMRVAGRYVASGRCVRRGIHLSQSDGRAMAEERGAGLMVALKGLSLPEHPDVKLIGDGGTLARTVRLAGTAECPV